MEIERDTPLVYDSESVYESVCTQSLAAVHTHNEIWARMEENGNTDSHTECLETLVTPPKTELILLETVLSGGETAQPSGISEEDNYEQICDQDLLPMEDIIEVVGFQKRLKLFRKVIVLTIDIYKILPHLSYIEYPSDFRNIAKHNLTAAVESLLDQLVASRIPKHYSTFIAALNECGYQHIAKLLKERCNVDKSYQSRYIAIMSDTVKTLIAPVAVSKYLMRTGILQEKDVSIINKVHSSACNGEASVLLCEIIKNRHSRWYSLLVNALNMNGQTCAVEMLDIPELQSDYKTYGSEYSEVREVREPMSQDNLLTSNTSFSNDTICGPHTNIEHFESIAERLTTESSCVDLSIIGNVDSSEYDLGSDHGDICDSISENEIGSDPEDSCESTLVKAGYKMKYKDRLTYDKVDTDGAVVTDLKRPKRGTNMPRACLSFSASTLSESSGVSDMFGSGNSLTTDKEQNLDRYDEEPDSRILKNTSQCNKSTHGSSSSPSTPADSFGISDMYSRILKNTSQCKISTHGSSSSPSTPADSSDISDMYKSGHSLKTDKDETDSVSSGGSYLFGSGHILNTYKEEASEKRFDPPPNPPVKELMHPVPPLRDRSNMNVQTCVPEKPDMNMYETRKPEKGRTGVGTKTDSDSGQSVQADYEEMESRVCSSFSMSTTSVSSGGSDIFGSGHSPNTDKEKASVPEKTDMNMYENRKPENCRTGVGTKTDSDGDQSVQADYEEMESRVCSSFSTSTTSVSSGGSDIFGSGHSPNTDKEKASEKRFDPPPNPTAKDQISTVPPLRDRSNMKVEIYDDCALKLVRPEQPKNVSRANASSITSDRYMNASFGSQLYCYAYQRTDSVPASASTENHYRFVRTSARIQQKPFLMTRDYKYKPPYPLPIETRPSPGRLPLSDSPEEISDDETRTKTRNDTANKHNDSGHSDVFRYLDTGPIDIKRIHTLSLEELEKYVQNVKNERVVQKKRVEFIQQLTEELEGLSSDKDTMIDSVTEIVNVHKLLKTKQSDLESIAANQEDVQYRNAYQSKGMYSANQMEINNRNKNGIGALVISDPGDVGVDSIAIEEMFMQKQSRKLSSKDSAFYSCTQSQIYPIIEAHEQE